jgi:hypothetical protein
MSQVETSHSQPDELLDEFAAEVTRVAYPVALKYGVSGSSLDLELEIWTTITASREAPGRVRNWTD